MKLLVMLAALASSACIWGTRDSFHCDEDADCTLGEGGRCERERRCTAFDPACASRRSYTAHSEELTGVCYSDQIEPLNPCAAGQPPAPATGCFADVCAAEPACCDTGWTEACVLEAQVRCPDLVCETRLAITAVKGTNIEMFDLYYTPNGWRGAAASPARETMLTWLAPAPGSTVPRLASMIAGGSALLIDRRVIAVDVRPYQHVASVDFDRDGRDTIALSHGDGMNPFTVEIIKLDNESRRSLDTPATQRIVWADWDHDAFPDAFAFAGNAYHVIASIGEGLAARTLSATSNSAMPAQANATPGTAAVHGLEVADLDRDNVLDLIATGTTVRVHFAAGDTSPRIKNAVDLSVDCSPPVAPGGACDPTLAAFASAVAPGLDRTELFVGLFPQHTLYRGVVTGSQITFTPLTAACPTTCPGFIGMIARDLDGDHRHDLVAIDADLGIVTALSSQGYFAIYSRPVIPVLTGFTAVRTSVTGFMP